MGGIFGGGESSPAPIIAPASPIVTEDPAEKMRKLKLKSARDHRAQFGVDVAEVKEDGESLG
jgi:hypothetical protein